MLITLQTISQIRGSYFKTHILALTGFGYIVSDNLHLASADRYSHQPWRPGFHTLHSVGYTQSSWQELKR